MKKLYIFTEDKELLTEIWLDGDVISYPANRVGEQKTYLSSFLNYKLSLIEAGKISLGKHNAYIIA